MTMRSSFCINCPRLGQPTAARLQFHLRYELRDVLYRSTDMPLCRFASPGSRLLCSRHSTGQQQPA